MDTFIKTDLFRFATLRGPQLLSDDEKKRGFIFFEPVYDSPPTWNPSNPVVNSSNVPNGPAVVALLNSVESVRSIDPDLFAFGSWLIRKRRNNTFSYSVIGQKVNLLNQLSGNAKNSIWQTLLGLQVANNSNKVMLQEALTLMLVADHFIENFNTAFALAVDTGSLNEMYPYFYITANAKIVIPGDEVVKNKKSASQPSTSVNEAALKQQNAVQETLSKLNDYQSAIAELLSTEKKYALETAQAHQLATQNYQQAWGTFMDAVPETIIDAEKGTTDKIIPNNPATRALSKFEFEPLSLLSGAGLEGRVSTTTLSILNELNITGFNSVTEAVNEIENRMRLLGNSFSNSASDSKTQALVFNGSVWEMNNRIPRILPTDILYGYQICGVYEASLQQQHFDIEINTGYANPSVNSIIYHARNIAGNSSTDGLFTVLSTNGYSIKLRLFPNNKLVKPSEDSYLVQGTISLSNGKTVTFEETLKGSTCVQGVAKLVTAGDTPEEESNQLIGIQQLGIADYRKITQELCCYVPGEVSHIENVLKGEYKERATRRLLRTEDTTETSIETETENLTDVSSTERNEMHSEISKVLSADKSITANASASGGLGKMFSFTASAGYASNTAQTDSTSQAISYAKDVTTRAMERVVQKVSEKRTHKMIDEYEESNKHGLDNRGVGAQNVSGVYRWVDKVYKNQLVNYGRRLMYEIMVPEPARFLSSSATVAPGVQVLEKPVDPRTSLSNAGMLNAGNYQYWAALYNADVSACPSSNIRVSKAIKIDAKDTGGVELTAMAENMELPENYAADYAEGTFSYSFHPEKKEKSGVTVSIGTYQYTLTPIGYFEIFNMPYFITSPLGGIQDKLSIGVRINDLGSFNMTVVARCTLTQAGLQKWQNETYKAILDAYEDQKAAYEQALADAQAKTSSANSDGATMQYNPLQSRMIEMGELKKNCLQLLLEPFGYTIGVDTLKPDGRININTAFGNHAEKVRFFEAAFEWEIMSYIFYPYLWADEVKWKELFAKADTDILFRSFLQAGIAKVILSVRPGYEESVMYYLETGKINEGKNLAIEDDLYLSLLAEQLPVDGMPEGEPWETRLPTTLTVLQSDSVAVAATGLPCACDTTPGSNGFDSNNHTLVYAAASIGGTGVNGL